MTRGQVFLGGACAVTTWRQDIAIPALEAAGVTYYNPQLGVGEWTPECEAAEMQAKDLATVLLFVVTHETRGVATIGEISYYLGTGRPLALSVTDVGAVLCGNSLEPAEQDDLNRGRIFVRTMARRCGVPVFGDVQSAVEHAIGLVKSAPSYGDRLRGILAEIRFKGGRFLVHERVDGFLIQLACEEADPESGRRELFFGRKWHVERTATEDEIVRTAFKAVATWQEHEARDLFSYRGVSLFSAHQPIDRLAGWSSDRKMPPNQL